MPAHSNGVAGSSGAANGASSLPGSASISSLSTSSLTGVPAAGNGTGNGHGIGVSVSPPAGVSEQGLQPHTSFTNLLFVYPEAVTFQKYRNIACRVQVRTSDAQLESEGAKVLLGRSSSLAFAGQLKNWRGEYAEALPLQAESLHIAREHNLLMPLLFVIWDTWLALTGKGDYDEALATFEEGLRLSEKVGAEIRRLRGAHAPNDQRGDGGHRNATECRHRSPIHVSRLHFPMLPARKQSAQPGGW